MSPAKKMCIVLIVDASAFIYSVNDDAPYNTADARLSDWVSIISFIVMIALLISLSTAYIQSGKSSDTSAKGNHSRQRPSYNTSVESYNGKVQRYNNSINPWLMGVNQYPQAKPGTRVTTTYEKNVQGSAGNADLKVQNSTNPNGSTMHESRFVGSRRQQDGRIQHTIQHTITTTGAVPGHTNNPQEDYYLGKQGQHIPLHHPNMAKEGRPYNTQQPKRISAKQRKLNYTNNTYPVYQPSNGPLRKQ